MGLIECLIITALRRLGRASMDRLAKIVFLIDRLGGFEALDWERIDLVLTSPEFLSAIERLTKDGVIKAVGNFITALDNNYDPGCGWFENSVKSATDYVINKYGNLSDGELDEVIDSILEGVY